MSNANISTFKAFKVNKMALYQEYSSILIYKSDPNRKRVFTVPTKTFIDKGDISDKDLMERWKTKLEYLGHSDIEIYLTKSINEDIPIGEDGRIWTYYHFRLKRYDNPSFILMFQFQS